MRSERIQSRLILGHRYFSRSLMAILGEHRALRGWSARIAALLGAKRLRTRHDGAPSRSQRNSDGVHAERDFFSTFGRSSSERGQLLSARPWCCPSEQWLSSAPDAYMCAAKDSSSSNFRLLQDGMTSSFPLPEPRLLRPTILAKPDQVPALNDPT